MKTPLRTEGLLIHKFPFQNSDLIITWFTRDQGRIKTIAKGALRPGSLYQGRVDLYYQCEIQFVSKSKSEIDTLKEIELKEPHLGLRRNYTILQLVHYFSEIVESLTEPRTPIEPYYDLFQKAVVYLNHKEPREELIHRFEKKSLELAGISTENFISLKQTLESNGYRVPMSYSIIQALKTDKLH